MDEWRGYAVRDERVIVGGRTYALLVPADSERLLTDPRVLARFERDEYMPYWASLWPGALLLADVVAQWERPPPRADAPTADALAADAPTAAASGAAAATADALAAGVPTVLELGCGVGLAGLVALERGYRVTVSDYDEDALAFAQENARRNGLPAPAARHVDWRQTYADLCVDRILAADVLYEARNLAPVAEFIRRHLRPAGFALLSDANRSTAEPFAQVAAGRGLCVTETPAERPADPATPGASGSTPIRGRIYHVRRR